MIQKCAYIKKDCISTPKFPNQTLPLRVNSYSNPINSLVYLVKFLVMCFMLVYKFVAPKLSPSLPAAEAGNVQV